MFDRIEDAYPTVTSNCKDADAILDVLTHLLPGGQLPKNTLYYGDNYDILQRYVGDETVDLVYLDPPFKSDQNYNVLFAEQNGSRSTAQVQAFEDTWKWDAIASKTYHEMVQNGPEQVSRVLQAFRTALGENDMLAYLSMMAPRLVELRRVLKDTGSIYLHCDPTASHYLKALLDSIFGAVNFRNEIVWKRTHAHSSCKKFAPLHDIILFYSKSRNYKWNGSKSAHDVDYVSKHFTCIEPVSGRRFQPISLTGAGTSKGDSGKPWRGVDPTKVGRHWAIPKKFEIELGLAGKTTQEKLDELDKAGYIYWPKTTGGTPRLKWYEDELDGAAIGDLWIDIPRLSSHDAERLGYPTQKPEALLKRIIEASSNKGDVILDPFCGCGTAIVVAQALERKWIGIDITHLAISLIKHRLSSAYGKTSYVVIGEPVDIHGAKELAKDNPYQFQWWALGLVGARPVQQRKGPDKGIDGRIYFMDDKSSVTKQVIISVKSGKVKVDQLRDLHGTQTREKAEIGVFICMEEPTSPMRKEAASAGFYSAWGRNYPSLQILTVEELLKGKTIDYPGKHGNVTLKKAPKKNKVAGTSTLPLPE